MKTEWKGEFTWVEKYKFYQPIGVVKRIKKNNYKVYINIPVGFQNGRDPFTINNKCINKNRTIFTLNEAIKFAKDYEESYKIIKEDERAMYREQDLAEKPNYDHITSPEDFV